ncbi:MAG: hypothetical protein U0793_05600 [Gemmataceae bacterium]
MAPETSPNERHWHILSRWQEFEGEGRANLLRMIGLSAFYGVELINYHGLHIGPIDMPAVVDRPFHLSVTFVTLAWAMLSLGVLYCRRNGIFPFYLKFISTSCDLLLLTTTLTLADGPRSPLVVVYFLIVALAALRFSLRLIWFATAGAAAGYLFLLGFARWGSAPGWPKPDMSLPRYHQVIFLLALILTGVILGQVIRRVGWIKRFLLSDRQSGGGGS